MIEISDGKISWDASFINIPPFKDIWSRDESERKSEAARELSYIYYMASPKSEYSNYPTGVKQKKIIGDFIKDKKWKPDKLILEAVKKYEEMCETPSVRALKATDHAMDQITQFLSDIKKRDIDTEELKIAADNIKKVMDTIDKMAKTVSSRAQIKEMVEKEQSEKSHIRGGVKSNVFTG